MSASVERTRAASRTSRSREPSGISSPGRSKVRTRSDPSCPVAPTMTKRPAAALPALGEPATGRLRSARGGRERDQMVEVADVEGLGDVSEHTAAQRLGRGLVVRVGGDHDDRDVHAQTAHLLEELEAPHARHVHVQQDQIELALQQDDQRLCAVPRRLGLVRMRVAELTEEILRTSITGGSSSTIRTRLVTQAVYDGLDQVPTKATRTSTNLTIRFCRVGCAPELQEW